MLKIQDINTTLVKLNDREAGNMHGGAEKFTITNNTGGEVLFSLDGTNFALQSGFFATYTAYQGGKVTFDASYAPGYQASPIYNLSNGGSYQFLPQGSNGLDLYTF